MPQAKIVAVGFLLSLVELFACPVMPLLAADEPAWTQAHLRPPMTDGETRAFIQRLARYAFEHHLKPGDSPQRGLVYEYLRVDRAGKPDQFVEGEALDTMHDGAWLAAALVSANRATGDPQYRELLIRWQLPFYLQMLNHSDTLFTAKRNDARPDAPPWNREHGLQEGERGFVPYWWDNGTSVSLERMRSKNPLAAWPSVDFLAGKPNPQFKLDGYSQGSSNHMAQDLAVMLQQAWLLVKDQADEPSRKLAGELAAGARNLYECRMRHFGHIPMVDAASALSNHDSRLLEKVRPGDAPALWTEPNAYARALRDFKPGQRQATPGFADDQQYNYYYGVARAGGRLPEPLAFRTIYDAFTLPQLYAYYCDDAKVPAGTNRFDLHPIYFQDGKPQDYRSDRKGPFKGPRPIGSRMGPQNMVVCGWALQALRAYPGIWEKPYHEHFKDDTRVYLEPATATDEPKRPLIEKPIDMPGVHLIVTSSRRAVRIVGNLPSKDIELTLFSRPDCQGPSAKVSIARSGKISATNDAGVALLISGKATAMPELTRFWFELPYTVVKGQAAWANPVEHGRYSIQVGDESRNYYLASREDDVRAWLEHELAGGLRTWQAIFEKYGYIPSGIGAGSVLPGVDWDRFSDSGGYAHLINAASQWLLCLDKKSDWQMHNIPPLLDEAGKAPGN